MYCIHRFPMVHIKCIPNFTEICKLERMLHKSKQSNFNYNYPVYDQSLLIIKEIYPFQFCTKITGVINFFFTTIYFFYSSQLKLLMGISCASSYFVPNVPSIQIMIYTTVNSSVLCIEYQVNKETERENHVTP